MSHSWTHAFGQALFTKVEFSMGGQLIESTSYCDHCGKSFPTSMGEVCFHCGKTPNWVATEKIKKNFKAVVREIEQNPVPQLKHVRRP